MRQRTCRTPAAAADRSARTRRPDLLLEAVRRPGSSASIRATMSCAQAASPRRVPAQADVHIERAVGGHRRTVDEHVDRVREPGGHRRRPARARRHPDGGSARAPPNGRPPRVRRVVAAPDAHQQAERLRHHENPPGLAGGRRLPGIAPRSVEAWDQPLNGGHPESRSAARRRGLLDRVSQLMVRTHRSDGRAAVLDLLHWVEPSGPGEQPHLVADLVVSGPPGRVCGAATTGSCGPRPMPGSEADVLPDQPGGELEVVVPGK